MGFTIPTIYTAIDKLTAPVRGMQRTMNAFAASAEVGLARAERGFRRLMSPLIAVKNLLGSVGVFLGGALIVAALGNTIGIFKDFEKANSNLSAVLGKSQQETVALAIDAKRLGAITAFTASQVVGLQTEYAKLGFTQREILASTAPTLALAAATNTDLAQSATQVGAAIRSFGLDASEAARVSDVFAAATSKSALDMQKLFDSMSTVAPVAKQFGFSIEDTTALLGKLSDAGFDASTAATSTRNIILNLADSNGKLARALGKPANTLPDLVKGLVTLREKGIDLGKMLELTDKRSVAAFATFLDGASSVEELSRALKHANGYAQLMADTQLNNLEGSLTIMKSAWEGWVLSVEDGNGQLSKSLKLMVDVVTQVLAMNTAIQDSGTKSKLSLSEQQQQIATYRANVVQLAHKVEYWTKVVLGLVGAIALVKAALIAWKGLIIAYKVVVFAASAAQMIWNALLVANPIGLLIAGISALIALISYAIIKWNEWGAAFSIILGPLGIMISIIQSFRRNWDAIVKAFKTEGILGGLKKIGLVILDALIMPLEQVAKLVANLTGFKWAEDAVKGFSALRQSLGVNTETDENGRAIDPVKLLNPEASRKQVYENVFTNSMKIGGAIRILDPNNRTSIEENNNLLPLQYGSTVGGG